jgi:hypothetical protein
MAQKPAVFIFKKPDQKSGFCAAKVIFVDKESAAKAIAEYNSMTYLENNRFLI